VSNFRGGSGPEAYYSEAQAGTALTTFTTEASLMGNYPLCPIPATWFDKAASLESSTMKVRAYVVMGDTTVAPTFAVSIRLTTSTTFATTNGWLSTAMTLAAVSQTLCYGQLDADLTLRTLGAAASTSTLVCNGTWSGDFATTIPQGTIPARGGANTFTTLDTSGGTATYWLWIGATCGTSNAANSIQLQQLKVYLEN
jgi:hypothetical protein